MVDEDGFQNGRVSFIVPPAGRALFSTNNTVRVLSLVPTTKLLEVNEADVIVPPVKPEIVDSLY